MKRCFRLSKESDFKRVRRVGKSYAHPLVVLYALKTDYPGVRVGVSAGLAVGNAVNRNRAKRLLRAAMNELMPQIHPGSDMLLIARSPLPESDLRQARSAVSALLAHAGLLMQDHES